MGDLVLAARPLDTTHATNGRARQSAPPQPFAFRQLPYSAATTIPGKSRCACGGGCPKCETGLAVQTKAALGQPGDVYEQEADRVAAEVMRMAEPNVLSYEPQ